MDRSNVFSQIRVLELASVLAGPAVGQFFAELGADVVKVEPRGTGDVTRTWRMADEKQDMSAYFTAVNWGKRSVALDLRDPADMNFLHRLIGKSDILISSFRPGVSENLGLDYASVSVKHPKLLYGQITGYGLDNPRAGYDAVLQAESGFMFLNSNSPGLPQKMPVALIDLLAGHQLKEALLVALIRRMNTGRGAHVSVSLLDAAVSSLANQGANYLVAGSDPAPTGSLHPNIAPYGEIVTTRDGLQVILAIGNDRQFQALTGLNGLESLASDDRFATNRMRVAHRAELFPILQQAAASRTRAALLEYFHNHHIPAGEIRTAGEAIEASRAIHLNDETLRGIRTFIASGLELPGHISRPPQLNEHAAEIRKDWLEDS